VCLYFLVKSILVSLTQKEWLKMVLSSYSKINVFFIFYFKSLWSKYKAQSKVLEEHQTLYSFRHTGAIDILKRTGLLTKLQKAMGHSSLCVSLTYLRGLEASELQEEDMPMIS